jgi:hypothetical protein
MPGKFLQIISMCVLIYLCADAFSHIEFAVSKNNALIAFEKETVDSAQSIGTVKQIAKDNLDIIRRIHRNNSQRSRKVFFLLIAVVLIQLYIFLSSSKRIPQSE